MSLDKKHIFLSKYDIPEAKNMYVIQEKDYKAFAECSALAYEGYPYFQYLCMEKYDKKAVQMIWSILIKSGADNMLPFGTSEGSEATALFAPPGFTGAKLLPYIKAGGLKLPFVMYPGVLSRLLGYENYSMELKKKYTGHKAWYLFSLTVRPEYQGKKMASSLLKPMFEYFDRTGQDCFLETHTEKNVEMYRHFGFEVAEKGRIPQTNICHCAMLRKAGTAI